MDHLFYALQISAVAGMTYVGWRSRGYIAGMINTPTIKPYKDKIGFKPGSFVNEDRFCGIAGSLTGMVIGRAVWPIAIPVSMFFIEKDYGDRIRKFLKDITK
jgi:hypothetical protein